MRNPAPQTIGILGAGKAGSVIARLAIDAGIDVSIASSGSAADTAELFRAVAPGARATTVQELPAHVDLVVLAVPLRRFHDLPLALLADHVVVDVMNYWPPVDGVLPEFHRSDGPSSSVARGALPDTTRLVKAFNHLGYHQMEELARPVDAANRAALAIAGDDLAALVDRLGFDPVMTGTLADSAAIEPGSALFGMHLDAHSMRHTLAAASGDHRAA